MGGRTYMIGGIVLAVAAFLAVNMFANQALTRFRLDLTEQRLFTLSEGTRNVIGAIDEPVTLRLYVSRSLASRLPSISGYVARVRDLLQEYEHAADGKIILTVIDPEPFSEEEDRAVAYGLSGLPLLDGESTFYFGLVGTNTLDDQEVIPRFTPDREEFLEYDLTKMIHTLGQAERPVIGLLTGLPLDGRNQQAMMMGRPPATVDHLRAARGAVRGTAALPPWPRADRGRRGRPHGGAPEGSLRCGPLRHRPVRPGGRTRARLRGPERGGGHDADRPRSAAAPREVGARGPPRRVGPRARHRAHRRRHAGRRRRSGPDGRPGHDHTVPVVDQRAVAAAQPRGRGHRGARKPHLRHGGGAGDDPRHRIDGEPAREDDPVGCGPRRHPDGRTDGGPRARWSANSVRTGPPTCLRCGSAGRR